MRTVSQRGKALNAAYEIPDKDGDGVPDIQVEAYLDDVGYWTGPGGIRFHDDGTPVKQGDKWTREGAWRSYGSQLDDWADDVLKLCKISPDQNQLDALVLLAWNIGIPNFRESTVLKKHNEGRFEEAAEAFGMWIYATQKPGVRHGQPVIGPDGHRLTHPWKKALRGLYGRHCLEGCLYLGREGLNKNSINSFLEVRVAETVFQRSRQRWKDEVAFKTPWAEIVAKTAPATTVEEDIEIPAFMRGGAELKPEPKGAETVTEIRIQTPPWYDELTPKQKTRWLNMHALKDRAPTLQEFMVATTIEPKKPKEPVLRGHPEDAASKAARGRSKVESGKEGMGAAGVIGAVTVAMPVIKETTSFFDSFPVQSILYAGGALALVALFYGGWRWYAGRMIEYEAETESEAL